MIGNSFGIYCLLGILYATQKYEKPTNVNKSHDERVATENRRSGGVEFSLDLNSQHHGGRLAG